MKLLHKNAFILSLIILIFDRWTKMAIVQSFSLGQSFPLIQNILHLTLVHNKGAAFGMLQGQRTLFIVLAVVILGFIAFEWKKVSSKEALGLGLLVGGIIGNLLDRVFLGYVIDFIDFRVFPVFNIADSAITIGVIWLLITQWKK